MSQPTSAAAREGTSLSDSEPTGIAMDGNRTADHPPEIRTGPPDRRSSTRAARLGVLALFAVLLSAMSVVTVLRYTLYHMQADGVMQSVMSVQDVDLFFWGQNRLASVVPLLASPFANPDVNLFVCLLINALCFHGLLLVIAWMGVRSVSGERSWSATFVLFLILAATAHTIIHAGFIQTIALETQPYSMSWLLALGAFMLWKRREWWALLLAFAMVGVAMGLNPSVILGPAFLSLIEMIRRRQWFRWPVFGVAWAVWFAVWAQLSARFGETPAPIPLPEPVYFAFDFSQLMSDLSRSTASILGAISPARTIVLIVIACFATLMVSHPLRAGLLPRLALIVLFAAGYWAVFAGNPWVAENLYLPRYFYPVFIALAICIAAPISGALVRIRTPVVRTAVTGFAIVACTLSLAGPLTLPSRAAVFEESAPTADFAMQNGIHFLSGYYWDIWPMVHQLLAGGRDAAFGVGPKSGGDPAAYRSRFDADLATGSPVRALCVQDSVENCQMYLDYWLKPGWTPVPGETCPVPNDTSVLGGPTNRVCWILEYTGSS